MSWNFFDVNGNLKEAVSPMQYTYRHLSAAPVGGLVPGDYYIFLQTNLAAANFTITLPSAVGKGGTQFLFLDIGANAHNRNVTIDAPGVETLDGSVTGYTINVPREQVGVVSDGTSWYTT